MTSKRRVEQVPGQLRLAFPDDPVAIRMTLERSFSGDRTIVAEMGVCRGAGRIDLAVIGEELEGFEIKADRDDLTRLHSQIATFGLVFDRLTLVAVARHLEASAPVVPQWWGLQAVDARGEIVMVRPARPNQATDPLAVAGLLWRDELLQLLRSRGHRGRRGTRDDFCRELVESCSPMHIRDVVTRTLKQRSSWRAAA